MLPEEKSSDGDERKRSENEDERKKNHLLADKIQSAKFPQVKMMIAILEIEPFSNYYLILTHLKCDITTKQVN
jgi:hypothetical protein